jgi:hypothetical protein
MKLFFLHSASIDADGQLFIDCHPAYTSIQQARRNQLLLIEAFKNKYSMQDNQWVYEEHGHFIRIALPDSPSELQTHIEAYEAEAIA